MAMGRRLLIPAVAAALALPAASHAAPPANDSPAGAEAFQPYTSSNGRPSELTALAELVEATPDAGTAPCLGAASFARTVWYRVPEAAAAQQITVEAMGRTLDVLDLAAYVQPEVPAPPPPPPPPPEPTPPPEEPPTPRAHQAQAPPAAPPPEANACFGLGTGGAEDSEEPTSAVTLNVPPRHPVLIQVGRRGPVGAPDDERAVLALELRPLDALTLPAGDRADGATPAARRETYVDLYGATITGEDPAQPACPSLGTVWRKFTPGRTGRRLIRAYGAGVEALTVFSGTRPTAANALDCVNREGSGALEMVVPVRRRRPVWVRIGTDRSVPGTEGTLEVLDGRRVTVIDGGPGGADPTAGGPGGGFPDACFVSRAERARITGGGLSGRAGAYNRFRRVPLRLLTVGASVCDVELRLRGPRGSIYAKGRVRRLKGRTTVHLPRLRTFRRGTYRLEATAVNRFGRRVPVRARAGGRLR